MTGLAYSSAAPATSTARFIGRPTYSEIELAQRFAEDCGDEFLYIAATGQWYRREVDAAKQPYWAPDETGWLYTAIIITLRRVAEEAPRDIARKIGAAATVAAVEWLARPHFAGTAEHLEPGELGRQEAMQAALKASFRGSATAQQAQVAPTPPRPRPTYPAPPESPGGRQSAPEGLARFISESAAWREQNKPPA